MISFFSRFLFGFMAPFNALSFLTKDKRILLLSLLPILIGFTLLIGLMATWWLTLLPLLQSFIASLAISVSWVSSLLTGLSGVLSFVVMIFIFVFCFPMVAGLLASPANFLISNQVEKHLTPLNAVQSEEAFFDLKKTFEDLKITVLVLGLGFVLWLFFLIPVIGWATYPGIIALLAFEYLYYPMARRGWSLGQCIAWISSHIPESLGLGLVLSIGFGIPLVNVLLMPVAVVAGTFVFLKK